MGEARVFIRGFELGLAKRIGEAGEGLREREAPSEENLGKL